MSIIKRLLGDKKKAESKPSKDKDEESAIEKMYRHMNEGYGMFSDPDSLFPNDPDFMTPQEHDKAMKALFPRTITSWKKEIKTSTPAVFPELPATGTPTMDAANPTGKMPGAVPRGTSSMPYPSKNGRNSGIESGGMSMISDPMLRFPINPRVLKHFQSRIWITYNGCAIIATHEFVNRACDIPAQDAIAHGYKCVCSSHNHEHDDEHDANESRFLFDLKIEADKMRMNEICRQLNYKKKVFGVAIAIPRVKFKKSAKSPSDPSGNTPYSYADEYDPEMIEEHSYKGFAVVDPIWLTYEFDTESSEDPISPHFYEPTWYHTRTKKIHRSWCIRVINSEVPDILKPVYYFGGLSLTQMIYERVWCADKLANEAPLLAMTKRLLIADGNLDQLIADSRHTNLFFKAINYFRDNFSIFIKKPSSNVTQLDTSLADLTPLTMSQYQLVAAIAQIPVTKLLKNVPSGLQATGEYEWDDYAQSLLDIQKNDYTPLLRKHFELYLHSEYPDRKDLEVDIEWNPIDVPKEQEVVQMTSQAGQTAASLLGNNAITVAEARSMLRRSNLPAFQAITPKVPEILEKIEAAKDPAVQAQMQGGGMGGPGMPGAGGMPGGAPNQEQQQIDPNVAQNDQIFKSALKKVIAENQQGIDNAREGNAPPQNGDKNEAGPFQSALNNVKWSV